MTGGIEETLSVLFPSGGVTELRALADNAVHSGYFNDRSALAERAATLDSLPEVQGVYITLNEVAPALLSRRANRVKMNLNRKDSTTSDADILSRRWLPIDLDPVRPSGVSSTDKEHQAAIDRVDRIAAWLSERGFPDPVKADSGNGAHLLYRIELPNDDAATALVKSCLSVLDALFSDSMVSVDAANFNAARIWKLYGTTSKKGDNTPERPHRKSALLSVPEEIRVVSTDKLKALAGSLPAEPPKGGNQPKGQGLNLRPWLTGHGIGIAAEKPWQGGTLFVLDECPFSGSHRDGAFAIQFTNGAVFAGCHHASCGGGAQRWQELRERYEPRESRIKNGKRENPAPPPPPPAQPATDEAEALQRDRALQLLRTGDPLTFMLDVFNRDHVGDRTVAECLIMSVASQSVENTSGLHVAISGNSGKGKTHACNAMLGLIPGQFKIKGTVSNKALFYHPLRQGTVLLFDDVALSEDLQEVLKASTANFREPVEHRTLTSDRQVKICTIPERCVWWLAKVESPGDDQVMNRMLTIWIDDSEVQDRAVLEHMKVAAARLPTYAGEDPDLLVCRAVWEILKERILHVRIPYAPRIHFSASQNRRNPGMLFDLIRCHAVLFSFQRERDEHGSLIATEEDFVYARQLFLEITGSVGGQETKQTRNEAAALDTMAKLGLKIFTITQLQESLGLSYHQTYRLLHGYSTRKGTYSGILDKCPAVSYIDATVAEEVYGVELKRREHYFAFDPVQYRLWSRNAAIWLDKDDKEDDDNADHQDDDHQGDSPSDVCTFASGNVKDGTMVANEDQGDSGGSLCTGRRYIERERCEESHLHTKTEAPGMMSEHPDDGPGGCGDVSVANRIGNSPVGTSLNDHAVHHSPFHFQPGWKPSQNVANVVKTGKKNTQPLPGLLTCQDFRRVYVDLGRCDICDAARVAYKCEEKQMKICEGCYARLVREWNLGRGVR